MADASVATTNEWWTGAVIYEIYPRSFFDTNGDGVGDLHGITAKLDYVAALGVDAVWIAPFYQSPMADFGYDITDHRRVDPVLGRDEDITELIEAAHDRDLRVIVDVVLSYTSAAHHWFAESRRDRDNPRADWFVWADARPDGSPPNNWLSLFGGSAWQWDSQRGQYYLHHFLRSQPDLNFHNAAVREQALKTVKYWLDAGVDGLRIDAVNFYFHDLELRDNPPLPSTVQPNPGVASTNPYARQLHRFSHTRPENVEFLKEVRTLTNAYPHVVTIGELAADDTPAAMDAYIGDDRLHAAYGFELLTERSDRAHIADTVLTSKERLGERLRCWSLSNHDSVRAVTRWGGAAPHRRLPRQLIALVTSLRGPVCLYQGEELGLPQARLTFDQLRDPYGIEFWPEYPGRDGCRTPMPWDSSKDFHGFSSTEPWLPIPVEHHRLAVSSQESDPQSVLSWTREFLRWRRTQPSLIEGDIEILTTSADTLAILRTHRDGSTLAVFNLTDTPRTLGWPADLTPTRLDAPAGVNSGMLRNDLIDLPPRGFAFFGCEAAIVLE